VNIFHDKDTNYKACNNVDVLFWL